MDDLLDNSKGRQKSGKRLYLRTLVLLVVGVYACSLLISAESASTVHFSGPTVAFLGIVTLISGITFRAKLVAVIGGLTFLSVFGIFLLICLSPIYPHDAQYHIFTLGGFCLLLIIGFVIWFFVSGSESAS